MKNARIQRISLKHLVLLISMLLISVAWVSAAAVYAEDGDGKTDIGKDTANIEYLTSYVYEDSGALNGEIRLADTRSSYILKEGTDISFSAVDNEDGTYTLTVTALESSDKYTGSFSCTAEYVGIGKPKTAKVSSKETWKYLTLDSFDEEYGVSSMIAVISFSGTAKKADVGAFEDYLFENAPDDDDIWLDRVLPGSFYNNKVLVSASLGTADYEPYIFVNCPNLSSIKMISEEYTTKTSFERDIKPIHMGQISATNTDSNGEPVHKIKLTVNNKAAWFYIPDNGDEIKVMDMSRYCETVYRDYYIMDSNTREFEYKNWLIRVAFDANDEPEVFTILKYKPKENDDAALNVEELTLPSKVRYGDENNDTDDYYFEDYEFYLDTNVFDGLPNLKVIRTGGYQLTAPLANNCPKLEKIISDFAPDYDEGESGIWQDDCENLLYLKDLKPLVNRTESSEVKLQLVCDNYSWLMEEPKTDEEGHYIDPDGKIVDDPEDADFTVFTMAEYCSLFGYEFPGVSMKDARLRINAHNSQAAIAGEGPLVLSVWRSFDSEEWEDDEAEWYPARSFFTYNTGGWKIEAAEGSEHLIDKVTLDSARGTLTVDPTLDKEGVLNVSCDVTLNEGGSITSFTISTALPVLPRISADTGSEAALYVDEEGNTIPDTGKSIPFIVYTYDLEAYGSEDYSGKSGDEQCEWEENELAYYEELTKCCFSLETYEDGKPVDQIAELDTAGMLLFAKDTAEPGDKFVIRGTAVLEGVEYTALAVITVQKQSALSDEDKELIPEDSELVIGTFCDSESSELAQAVIDRYSEFADSVYLVDMDEGNWQTASAAYADYMEGVDLNLYNEDDTEPVPDIIIWPAYMLEGQQGGPAAAAFEDFGVDLSGDGIHRYDSLKDFEQSDGKTYAVALSVNPGGFVYNKAAAKAVLGTDEPAEVQKAIGSWEGFVDVIGMTDRGEHFEDGAIVQEGADGEKFRMLSSTEYLSDALICGRGTTDGEFISMGGDVLDYLTVCQKLEAYGAVGSEEDLFSGKAFGRFVTEADTLDDARLADGLSKGTLGIVRGPSSFAGEGTELATITKVKENPQAGFAKLFLKYMLSDTAAMDNAYEEDPYSEYFPTRFPNNSEWQASLDDSKAEGKGIRKLWNAVAADMKIPASEPVSTFVQDYIADRWDTDHQKSVDAIADGLGTEYICAVKTVSSEDSMPWPRKQYIINRNYDQEDIARFDLTMPREDPETGESDKAEQARFDRAAAASVVSSSGDEMVFYSLTRAMEAAAAQDGEAGIKLFKDMEYKGGSFETGSAVFDLNGRAFGAAEGSGEASLLTLEDNAALTIINSAEGKAGAIDGSAGYAAVDAGRGSLHIDLGSDDIVAGHILLNTDSADRILTLRGGRFDPTASADVIGAVGRKSYIENFADGDADTFSNAAGLVTADSVTDANRAEAANLYVMSEGYAYSETDPVPEVLYDCCFRMGSEDAIGTAEAEEKLTAEAMLEYGKSLGTHLNNMIDEADAMLNNKGIRISRAGDGSDVLSGRRWITEEDQAALESAAQAAAALRDKGEAPMSEIFETAEAVRAALQPYRSAQDGAKAMADAADLSESIAEAEGVLAGCVPSDKDGKDVAADKMWLPRADYDELKSLYDNAKKTAGNPASSPEEIDVAARALFDKLASVSLQKGTKEGSAEEEKVQPKPAVVKPVVKVTLSKIKIKSAKAGKKKITVKWKKLSKSKRKKAAKIQIQYSRSKKFNTKDTKIKTVKSSKTSYKIKKLKSKKKYYVRIRAYTKKGNVTYVSKWSKAKKVKVK